MPLKRKSDAMESATSLAEASSSGSAKNLVQTTIDHPNKKTRVSDASNVASTSETDKEASETIKPTKPQSWKDIKLDGEDEGDVPIYDDCGEVRRKIRLLQKTPGWKVTHWLKDIGGINNNSFGRFMREKGKTDGASNGTYYAAYVYFEKVRIFENKKKTAKRVEAEKQHSSGLSRERPSMWVWGR